jgi:hypothetical protein
MPNVREIKPGERVAFGPRLTRLADERCWLLRAMMGSTFIPAVDGEIEVDDLWRSLLPAIPKARYTPVTHRGWSID